jgi:hypothetical protein
VLFTFLFKAFVWWQLYQLALLTLGMMGPSAVRGKLVSLYEASSICATEGAHIDAYFINKSGEEVKIRVDILCAHQL